MNLVAAVVGVLVGLLLSPWAASAQSWPTLRFGTAGPPASAAPYGGAPSYIWDCMSWSGGCPDGESLYIVSKLDSRGDGLSCDPCSDDQLAAIFDAEQPTLSAMLSRPSNTSKAWQVFNESNSLPWLDPVQAAAQWQRYEPLIHGLDPTARMLLGGLIYFGSQQEAPGPCSQGDCHGSPYSYERPDLYASEFLAALEPQGGSVLGLDGWALHLYPHGTAAAYNAAQLKAFHTWQIQAAQPANLWVTEFGVDGTNGETPEQYQAALVQTFIQTTPVQNAYWFIGTNEPGYETTALTQDGAATPLGDAYVALLRRWSPRPGDAVGNGGPINVLDYSVLVHQYGQSTSCRIVPVVYPCGDLDGDGVVDRQDLAILRAHFGEN